jgi:hypothetical protein
MIYFISLYAPANPLHRKESTGSREKLFLYLIGLWTIAWRFRRKPRKTSDRLAGFFFVTLDYWQSSLFRFLVFVPSFPSSLVYIVGHVSVCHFIQFVYSNLYLLINFIFSHYIFVTKICREKLNNVIGKFTMLAYSNERKY